MVFKAMRAEEGLLDRRGREESKVLEALKVKREEVALQDLKVSNIIIKNKSQTTIV